MAKKLDTTFIRVVHPVCCGLDVHKKKISACLITVDEHGQEQYEIEEFGTFTNDLLNMKTLDCRVKRFFLGSKRGF